MSEELSAISKVTPAPATPGDYDSICAALMQTERGRWFLQEYARRNRSADTQLLLAAIQRIEAVVCTERNKQAQQSFRTDLLEMAKAITRTRAEVAEIRSDPAKHPEAAPPERHASPLMQLPQPRDAFAAAERIRDVTWAMRGHGFDPSTCDQLEELAAAILSASSLHDPTDRRASKLSEVLQYLEHRIDTLLEGSAEGDPADRDPAAYEPEPRAPAAANGAEAEPANGFAGTFVTMELELPATGFEAGRAAPLPASEFEVALLAAHDDLEGDTTARAPPAAAALPPEEVFLESAPVWSVDPAIEPRDSACEIEARGHIPPLASDLPTIDVGPGAAPSEATDAGPELPIAAPNHEVGAQTADGTSHLAQSLVDAEPTATSAEPDAVELVADPKPAIESSAGTATAAADELGRRFDLGNAAPAGSGLPTAATATEALAAASAPVRSGVAIATDSDGERMASGPAEPIGLERVALAPAKPPSPAPSPPAAAEQAGGSAVVIGIAVAPATTPLLTATAPAQPAAAPALPAPRGDPLAALKAMPDDELIALFS